jgi:hypothetical protein
MSSLGLAFFAFLTGLLGPLGGMGPAGHYTAVLFFISLFFSVAWLILVIAAMIAIRWRGLWLLVAAPGAFILARDCPAHHGSDGPLRSIASGQPVRVRALMPSVFDKYIIAS